METNETNFKRYLVRELFWELDQHSPRPHNFVSIKPENVEVLTYSGYDDIRARIGEFDYDVHLSWRKDVSPIILKIDGTVRGIVDNVGKSKASKTSEELKPK